MSEPKKLTGLQKPLDISPALAKIIGTKKGEQVPVKELEVHSYQLPSLSL